MGSFLLSATRVLRGALLPILALFLTPATSAAAPEKAPLFTAYANLDFAAADGTRSWLDGGTGKARYGSSGNGGVKIRPSLSEAGIVMQPHLSWSVDALVSVVAQRNQDKAIDFSEAYLRWKPLPVGGAHLTVRAGLFWPPVSLEHGGGEWPVRDTVTPSAINSWIGEEVKVGGIEGTLAAMFGSHRLTLTAAVFGLNDTSGTLLTFRGWALHDLKATAFSLQPLPTLNAFMQGAQAQNTRPLIELDDRAGWYAKLSWALPGPLELQYFHYDNRGDPEAVNATLQWGWRTRFDHLGAILDLGPRTRLTAQAIRGTTIMGFPSNGVRWVDMRYRSAFLLATRKIDWSGRPGSASARLETFDTHNRGSQVGTDDDETGWAATLAARCDLRQHVSLFAEGVHIDSRRDARLRDALPPHQKEDILRLVIRLRS